ncbi:MAG TPA: hypothetical protein VHT51_20815, partial [Micropepsaceae bacterium]|nr:hypothetical protein [Micropepsaceae bacterium]
MKYPPNQLESPAAQWGFFSWIWLAGANCSALAQPGAKPLTEFLLHGFIMPASSLEDTPPLPN